MLINLIFVTVPPHRIVILDENGVVRNSKVGPYTEGDTLKLSCDVYGGKCSFEDYVKGNNLITAITFCY